LDSAANETSALAPYSYASETTPPPHTHFWANYVYSQTLPKPRAEATIASRKVSLLSHDSLPSSSPSGLNTCLSSPEHNLMVQANMYTKMKMIIILNLRWVHCVIQYVTSQSKVFRKIFGISRTNRILKE